MDDDRIVETLGGVGHPGLFAFLLFGDQYVPNRGDDDRFGVQGTRCLEQRDQLVPESAATERKSFRDDNIRTQIGQRCQ